jgi:hypothetical protein
MGNRAAYRYSSLDAKYAQYCFHRPRDLEAFCALLDPTATPHVALLVAPEGFGRSYFVEAAVHRARQDGRPFEVLKLDLKDYEPHDESGLLAFVEARARRRDSSELWGKLTELASALEKVGQATGFWAGALSMILSAVEPLRMLQRVLSSDDAALAVTTLDPAHLLQRLMDAALERGSVVVHVPHAPELSLLIRDWLLDFMERFRPSADRQVRLVFSCTPGTDDLMLRSWHQRERFELAPLDAGEIHQLVSQRFVGECPEELALGLTQYSGGWPGLIARSLQELVRSGCLSEHAIGAWELNEGAMEPGLGGAFSQAYYAPLRGVLERLGADAILVRQFLLLAALCSPDVPARLLMEALGLDEEQQEHLVDVVDDHFTLDGRKTSLRFLHDNPTGQPSFKGHPIYRFTDPLVPRAILDHSGLGPNDLADRARALLTFLGSRLNPSSRGIALLFLHLAEYAGDARLLEDLRLRLVWWTTRLETEKLTTALVAAVERGELDPGRLWIAIDEHLCFEHQQMALLTAYEHQPNGIPVPRMSEFHRLFARAMVSDVETGFYDPRLEQALARARYARELTDGESAQWYLAATTERDLLLRLGRVGEAEQLGLTLQSSQWHAGVAATIAEFLDVVPIMQMTAESQDRQRKHEEPVGATPCFCGSGKAYAECHDVVETRCTNCGTPVHYRRRDPSQLCVQCGCRLLLTREEHDKAFEALDRDLRDAHEAAFARGEGASFRALLDAIHAEELPAEWTRIRKSGPQE